MPLRFFGTGNYLARNAVVALLAGLYVLFAVNHGLAVVLSNGDVIPADDPFTPTIDEGIPLDGNFIDPFAPTRQEPRRPFEDLIFSFSPCPPCLRGE